MRIKYKEPWCLNPDIISYGMNKGKILSFDESDSYTLHIRFSIIKDAERDELSNIVWKGNDELGIQLFVDEVENQNVFTFTFRNEDDQENKQKGILKFFVNTPIDILDYQITVCGDGGMNYIYVNGKLEHEFGGKLIFIDHSSYNFGGGHGDNIEYDINFLVISKKHYTDQEIRTSISNENITEDVMGWYDFQKRTEQKVWDKSDYFNLINRFFL